MPIRAAARTSDEPKAAQVSGTVTSINTAGAQTVNNRKTEKAEDWECHELKDNVDYFLTSS